MSSKKSVYDTIPLKDLQRISTLQERAVELEHQASVMMSTAQDLRIRVDDIVADYRCRVKKYGWDACRAEAERENAISWYHDPLPGQGAKA